jgi:hypothetical protein
MARPAARVFFALIIALATMAFECGPPGRDLPCSDQIAEGDVLHVELIARYAPDGEIWAGADISGYGAMPSCEGIDGLATGASFDAVIRGGRETMLCTQFEFLPRWDAPQFGHASLTENVLPAAPGGSSEVALSSGAIATPAGCVGLYGISLFTRTGDVFAEPSLEQPYGTVIKRYFGTKEPEACGAEFSGLLNPTGASYCGDMYLVRVTR